LANACADETQTSDSGRTGRGFRIQDNSEHSGSFQGFLKHLAIAGFENTKGQELVGEKDCLREKHDPYLLRKIHWEYLHPGPRKGRK
jgi:hypothetical protein